MNDWIPIENVIPKNMGIIAYGSSGLIAILDCDDFGNFSFVWDNENTEDNMSILGDVVAWMPLPEPYRYEKCKRDIIKMVIKYQGHIVCPMCYEDISLDDTPSYCMHCGQAISTYEVVEVLE